MTRIPFVKPDRPSTRGGSRRPMLVVTVVASALAWLGLAFAAAPVPLVNY